MTTSFYVQIPDPALRQFDGHSPNFIAKMPPDIAGLEVHVDWEIVTYLDESENAGVKDYLLKIEALAKDAGLKIVRNQDLDIREFVYTFEKRE